MTVGILGGGQLGRMLALSGYPLGLDFRVLDPSPEAPARHLALHFRAEYDDLKALQAFASDTHVVTYEFENVPVSSARILGEQLPVYPPPEALEIAQDRFLEKNLFRTLDIPTPPFVPVDTESEFADALEKVGVPAVLKTRRFGYDGKGQVVLRHPDDARAGWKTLAGMPLILEGFVSFEREVSILAVRGLTGETRFYPLVENHHRQGILHLSRCPAPAWTPELQARAESYATRILDALRYVGVLAIEFFELDGELLANELAPRVHNSGHWTIEGAKTSQFENHLRAILGLPLGSTETLGQAAMVNLIGTPPNPSDILRIPGAHLHLYGKSPRPGRKLGHVTVQSENPVDFETRLQSVRSFIGGSGNDAR